MGLLIPPLAPATSHTRLFATIMALILWPLCQVDPLLVSLRIGVGRLAFRLLCGARGTRPNGWWRTFYGINGLLRSLFTIPRFLTVFFVDCLAVAALAILGGNLSAREICRDVAADLRQVIADGCAVQDLKMALGWYGDAS
jgi:hypothetical protein